MTDRELLVVTVSRGERLAGEFDYETLRWRKYPRAFVSDISEVTK